MSTRHALPHKFCSAVQNAFRARHPRVGVQHSTQNLAILSILLRSGFISNLTRGTIAGPSPEQWEQAGEAERRIWAELKYRNDRPVLNNLELVSLPSKRVFMEPGEILRMCSGRRAQTVKPLGMGEIAVVRTNSKEHEWLEAREAVQMKMAGEVICRAR